MVRTYTLPPAEPDAGGDLDHGHRTPYGLAFAPDGRLWEVEHGPRGGDELNLIEPGKNYGWPLVSYATNYNGVPIPSPDTRPDSDQAGHLLDAGHRAGQSHVLQGPDVPSVGGLGLDRRPGNPRR